MYLNDSIRSININNNYIYLSKMEYKLVKLFFENDFRLTRPDVIKHIFHFDAERLARTNKVTRQSAINNATKLLSRLRMRLKSVVDQNWILKEYNSNYFYFSEFNLIEKMLRRKYNAELFILYNNGNLNIANDRLYGLSNSPLLLEPKNQTTTGKSNGENDERL